MGKALGCVPGTGGGESVYINFPQWLMAGGDFFQVNDESKFQEGQVTSNCEALIIHPSLYKCKFVSVSLQIKTDVRKTSHIWIGSG